MLKKCKKTKIILKKKGQMLTNSFLAHFIQVQCAWAMMYNVFQVNVQVNGIVFKLICLKAGL